VCVCVSVTLPLTRNTVPVICDFASWQRWNAQFIVTFFQDGFLTPHASATHNRCILSAVGRSASTTALLTTSCHLKRSSVNRCKRPAILAILRANHVFRDVRWRLQVDRLEVTRKLCWVSRRYFRGISNGKAASHNNNLVIRLTDLWQHDVRMEI